MAIDTSLWAVDIAAGAITKGATYELTCTDGPSVVRSGRGAAILKRISSFKMGAGGVNFIISIINSDWIDPVVNEATSASAATAFDRRTGGYQSGNNCQLTPNSSWRVVAVALNSGTATAGTLFTTIDIDYPTVSSIIDPDAIPGIPSSIVMEKTITSIAAGSYIGSGWTGQSEDFFKAGYEYALQKLSVVDIAGVLAFVSLSNAAGMGGLTRIVPCYSDASAIRTIVEYASKLVKGPLDVKVKLIGTSSGTVTTTIIMDYVKRKV